ncbi:MAG: hypothetical protein KAH01_05000 [Caldisericia bacterium]|nr:hypothetical protein [Caldisericia bacterium]
MPKWLIVFLGSLMSITLLVVIVTCTLSVKIPEWIWKDSELSLIENSEKHMNTTITMNADTKTLNCPQDFSSIIGYQSNQMNNFSESTLFTKTGFYITGGYNNFDFYPYDQKPYTDNMNLSVIRWDIDGNFQWEVVLDPNCGNKNLQKNFLHGKYSCVDDQENLYLVGRTNKRTFFSRWVPFCKNDFVLCLSKDKRVKWVHFDGNEYNNMMSLQLHDGKVYIVTSGNESKQFHSIKFKCLDSNSGRKLWTKSAKTTAYDFVHSDEHGMYLLSDEDNNTRILHCYDWKAQNKWSCEIPNPNTPTHTHLPSFQNRKITSCISSEDNVFLSLSSFVIDTENATSFNQSYNLYSINREGKLEWTQSNKPEESTSIIDIKYQNNLLCIVSQTNTQGLASKDAFQKELKGENDLLLSLLDMQGTQKWRTYIGGSGLEPYYISSLILHRSFKECFLDFKNDRIVIGCCTSSQDFPIDKTCPVHFNPYVNRWQTFSFSPL